MTPWSLAFEKVGKESLGVCHDGLSCTELITDIIFILEIGVAFNTAYLYMYDHQTKFQDNRWKIAKNYLLGWFLVDFLSVFPRFLDTFSRMTTPDSDAQEVSSAEILGIVKFARIARIIKLVRLVKIFKGKSSNKDPNKE